MANVPIQWREPDSFSVGDTLLFQRSLPDYLPSDGWAIRLTVSENTPTGIQKVVQVTSAPDATNTFHVFNVLNFCLGIAAGIYVLSEEVFNANGNAPLNIAVGQKQQIYERPDFRLKDNLDAGMGTAPVQTEAQQNLALLNNKYRALLANKFAETEDLRSRFRLADETKILEGIKYWKSIRILEIQHERARNGQSPGNTQEMILAIG